MKEIKFKVWNICPVCQSVDVSDEHMKACPTPGRLDEEDNLWS